MGNIYIVSIVLFEVEEEKIFAIVYIVHVIEAMLIFLLTFLNALEFRFTMLWVVHTIEYKGLSLTYSF